MVRFSRADCIKIAKLEKNDTPALYFSCMRTHLTGEGALQRGRRANVIHRLGRILVEYIELTDECSTLRGPPRDAGFFSHTSIDISMVLVAPPVD